MGSPAISLALARRIDGACARIGFALVTDRGLDPGILDEAFAPGGDFVDGERALRDRWHPAGISAADVTWCFPSRRMQRLR